MKRFFLIPLLGLLLAMIGCTCSISGNDPMPTDAPSAVPTANASPVVTNQPTAVPEVTTAPVVPTPAVSPSINPTAGN